MHSFEFSLKLGWSRQQYQIPYCLLFLWKTCSAKCRSYFTAKSFKFDSECVMTPWQVIFARTHPHLSSYLPPRQPKVATTNVSKCKVDFLSAPRQRFLWQRARRAGFTTFSREDEQRALCAPQAPVIDIWLGQFSFCAFGPSDNLVALSRDAHKGEPCWI